MKRFIRFSSIIIIFFSLNSCKDYTPGASEIAQQFIDAYFANDFNHAATFCNDEIASVMHSAATDFESIDPAIKKVVTELTSRVGYEIKNVTVSDKTNAIVEYEITTPESPAPASSYLKMSRIEKRWVVSSLNF